MQEHRALMSTRYSYGLIPWYGRSDDAAPPRVLVGYSPFAFWTISSATLFGTSA